MTFGRRVGFMWLLRRADNDMGSPLSAMYGHVAVSISAHTGGHASGACQSLPHRANHAGGTIRRACIPTNGPRQLMTDTYANNGVMDELLSYYTISRRYDDQANARIDDGTCSVYERDGIRRLQNQNDRTIRSMVCSEGLDVEDTLAELDRRYDGHVVNRAPRNRGSRPTHAGNRGSGMSFCRAR